MIERLIEEINSNLANGQTLSALICALILPDLCGQAEYPNERTGARYKKCYAKYVGASERPPLADEPDYDRPYADEEVIYDLRCRLLHQGDLDINSKKSYIVLSFLWQSKAY